jgi:hypothetical protein
VRFFRNQYADDRVLPQLHAAEVPHALEFEQQVAVPDKEMQSINLMVEAIRGTGMTPPPSSGEMQTHGLDSGAGFPP